MIGVSDISAKLPPYKNKRVVLVDRQTTKDIIDGINKTHEATKSDYDKISQQFWKGNAKDTARFIFDFLKKNVEYKIEPGLSQTVKTPSAIIAEQQGDCKHYASFIVGIADSLNRQGHPIEGAYMYVNSHDRSNNFHHVFGLVKDTKTGAEYWTDPIYNVFDQRKKYLNSKKISPMALIQVSGDYEMSGKGDRFTNRSGGKSDRFTDRLTWRESKADRFRRCIDEVDEMGAKKTKAERKAARQANKQARKANRQARKAERKAIRALPRPQRKEARKAKRVTKREDRKAVRKIATGGQKVAHIALKVPNAISRNAFLGLVKLNAFRMASKMAAKYHGDPGWQKDLKTAWYSAGGDWSKLKQAINQGVNVWNTRHTPTVSQISGPGGYIPFEELNWFPRAAWQQPFCNCQTMDQVEDQMDTIGEAAAAGGVIAAAAIAAAVPIILKLMSLLKRSGVDTDEIQEAGEEGTEEVLDEYNDAQEWPIDEDDPENYGQSDSPQFGIKGYNDPNDGTATIEYTKSNLNDNGDVSFSSGSFDLDMVFQRGREWVEDNKTALLWIGGGIVAIKVLPGLLASLKGKKRRR